MDAAFGQIYADLYREHWWFRVREAMLMRLIGGLPLPEDADLLDVGCGDALFMPRLAEHGNVQGIEIDERLLTDGNPFRGNIHTQPLGHRRYDGMQFDLITALDVIEHIEDDAHAVASMAHMLRPGGHMLITVPAFNALWDEHDEINHHFRRYTKTSLRTRVEPFGRVERLQYFFGALVLPKLAIKLLNGLLPGKVQQHGMPGAFVNGTMQRLFDLESRVSRWLPFGTSVLALVRKPLATPTTGDVPFVLPQAEPQPRRQAA